MDQRGRLVPVGDASMIPHDHGAGAGCNGLAKGE